jgi:hypothetical membrane protein
MDWNSLRLSVVSNYPWFGVAGSLLIILCMILTALVYRGKKGERYSVFNHYISELGEVGVSKAAMVFNIGLIIGSLAFLPFVIGMGLSLQTLWAKIGMYVGIWSILSCALVGVFPMNYLKTHYWVAISYFRSGLVMVLLFSIAVFVQPPNGTVIPKISNLAGLLAFLCYAGFLLISDTKKKQGDAPESALDPETEVERPKYKKAAILEWAVFFSTILWFLIVALFSLE